MKNIKFLIIALSLLVPFVVSASEIRLELSKVEIKAGDEILVRVVAHVDQPINAVEGTLVFDSQKLKPREILDGGSSVNLWIEKPEVRGGEIRFSGITPGGFEGTNNLLFSIVFDSKDEGPVFFSLKNAKALLNDGLGTEEALILFGAEANIGKGDSTSDREDLKDTIPPEPFSISIAQDPNVFSGRWFAAFSTQDKDSGISHYDVKEYKFKFISLFARRKEALSPYELNDQNLRSYIEVRAVDKAGNVVVSKLAPENPLLWYEYLLPSTIIFLSIFAIAYLLGKWK
jgi:hypothetical protein